MRFFLLLVLFFLLQIPKGLAAQQVIILTYDVLPPYAYRDKKGELTGVYIEIVKTAISRMPDYTVSFQVLPWSRAKNDIKQGRGFAILPPYFHAHDWLTDTEPKRPYIWPYSLPLFTQKDVVVCNNKKIKAPPLVYPDDYQGLLFVMWRGDGRAGERFDQMREDNKIFVQYVDTIKDTIRLLAYGRADCTVTSRLPFAWYFEQIKQTSEYEKFPSKAELKEIAVISSNEGYLGYSDVDDEQNYPYKKDFSIKFDIEIYKMKRSGEIDEIVGRFVNQNKAP